MSQIEFMQLLFVVTMANVNRNLYSPSWEKLVEALGSLFDGKYIHDAFGFSGYELEKLYCLAKEVVAMQDAQLTLMGTIERRLCSMATDLEIPTIELDNTDN